MSRTIAARVEDETYIAVTDAANAHGMSVNDWLKSCVEDHLCGKNECKQPGDDVINNVRKQHVDNIVTSPPTPELQRKWGFLIRGGKFTGSASEYQSYLADATARGSFLLS